MKRLLFILLFTFVLMGCSQEALPPADVGDSPDQEEATITIAGTGVAVLDKLAEAYKKENPQVKIEIVHGTHVAAGLKGVIEGKFQLVGLNRALTDVEKSQALAYYPFAVDGMCFVSHKQLEGIDNLTQEDVRRIYSGEVRTWSQIGGPSEDIVLLDRMEEELDKKILREKVLGPELLVRDDTVLITRSSEMIKTLAKIPNSLGFVSNGLARVLGVQLKMLDFEGIELNADNIASGKYPFTVTYALVSAQNPPLIVQNFLEFVYSEEGKKVLLEYGYLPKE